MTQLSRLSNLYMNGSYKGFLIHIYVNIQLLLGFVVVRVIIKQVFLPVRFFMAAFFFLFGGFGFLLIFFFYYVIEMQIMAHFHKLFLYLQNQCINIYLFA